MPYLYNKNMKLNSKELIKLLITKECLTQKELILLLNEKTNKNYSPDGFSHKLSRGTVTFNEIVEIMDILGYQFDIKKIED